MHTPPKRCAKPGRPCDPTLEKRRRDEILRHAVHHFARSGFAKTDVATIAESAGCSKGTIYNYFPSKLLLFQDTVDYVMLGLLDATSTPQSHDPVERLRQGIRSFLAYFDGHPEYMEILIQERAVLRDRHTPTYRRYRRMQQEQARTMFQSLIETGRFRDIHVDSVLEIIANTLYGTIFTNYFTGRSVSMEQQAADIADLLLNGLLSSKEPSG